MNTQNATPSPGLTDKLLTARECAERLGYKGASAWKRVTGLANRGMLPVLRLGRTMRFHWPSVLEAQFLPAQCKQPTSGGGLKSDLRGTPPRQTGGPGGVVRPEGSGPLEAFPLVARRTAARKRPDSGASDRTQRAAVVKARRSPIPPRKSSNPYL